MTVPSYGKAKQRRQRLFCVSPGLKNSLLCHKFKQKNSKYAAWKCLIFNRL